MKPNAWQTATRPCSIEIARERGEADDVAGGVDARDRGAEVLVDLDVAPRVDLDADRREPEAVGVAPTAGRDHHASPPRAALPRQRARQSRRHLARRVRTSAPDAARTPSDRIASASRSPISRSRNGSRPGAGRSACTWTPSAANMQAYSQPITPPPITAIDRGRRSMRRIPSRVVDVVVVVRDAGRAVRRRSGRDQDHVGGQARRRAVGRGDLDGVRIDEPSRRRAPGRSRAARGWSWIRPTSRWRTASLRIEEPRDRELRIEVDQHAVELPLPVAREEQRGLAQGLRWQRAGVDGGAPGLGFAVRRWRRACRSTRPGRRRAHRRGRRR